MTLQFSKYGDLLKSTESPFFLPGTGSMRHINGLFDLSAISITVNKNDRTLSMDFSCKWTSIPGMGIFGFK